MAVRRGSRPLCVLVALLLASLLPSLPRAAAEPGSPNVEASGGTVSLDGEEVVEKRTRTSKTFRTEGRYRTEFSPGSLHYQDAAGDWHPVDTTLVPSGTGFTTKADDTRVQLPASLRDPVVVTEDGASLSFRLLGAGGGTARATGNKATYADALPGVDVAYEADADSLKETLVLKHAGAVSQFAFDVATSAGLRLLQRGNALVAVDDEGDAVLSLRPPFMDDGAGTHSDAVTMSLSPDGRTLSLVADPAWLADPERVYPVVVDPTVAYAPTTDCSIHSATPLTADCALDTITVGTNGGASRHRGLLSFPEVTSAVRESATVLDAVLSLTQAASS